MIKYINIEKPKLAKKKSSKPLQPPKEDDLKKRKFDNRTSTSQSQEEKVPKCDQKPRPSRVWIGRYDNYHELMMNIEEVYARYNDEAPFRHP